MEVKDCAWDSFRRSLHQNSSCVSVEVALFGEQDWSLTAFSGHLTDCSYGLAPGRGSLRKSQESCIYSLVSSGLCSNSGPCLSKLTNSVFMPPKKFDLGPFFHKGSTHKARVQMKYAEVEMPS